MTLLNTEEPYILIYNEIFGDFLPLIGHITYEAGFFFVLIFQKDLKC